MYGLVPQLDNLAANACMIGHFRNKCELGKEYARHKTFIKCYKYQVEAEYFGYKTPTNSYRRNSFNV